MTARGLGMSARQRRALLVAEVRQWTKILAEQGLTTKGSMGQVVAHPGVAARLAAIKALGELDKDNPPATKADELEEFLNG